MRERRHYEFGHEASIVNARLVEPDGFQQRIAQEWSFVSCHTGLTLRFCQTTSYMVGLLIVPSFANRVLVYDLNIDCVTFHINLVYIALCNSASTPMAVSRAAIKYSSLAYVVCILAR